jgi:hypothetical protein
MERMVGMFVNTIPLRIRLRADEPFADLCVRIGHEATEAFERQTYQLNDLVADLELARDPSRNPLFDVLFAWEEADLVELDSSLAVELPRAQAPASSISSHRADHGVGQRITLLFTKVIQARHGERFVGNLAKVLEQVARTPGQRPYLRMLQPWERELLCRTSTQRGGRADRRGDGRLVRASFKGARRRSACEDAAGGYRSPTSTAVRRRSLQLIARGVQPTTSSRCRWISRELLIAIVGIESRAATCRSSPTLRTSASR